MTANPLIYIIEDNFDLCEIIEATMKEYGFLTKTFRTGQSALQALKKKKPDICLVDLKLPDMDGLNIVREMESKPDVGIIIMTGMGGEADRILGLEIGADDYLVKPINPRELVARIRSLVRRLHRVQELAAPYISQKARFDKWCFDIDTQTLSSTEGTIDQLCSTESQLLITFLRSPNRILSRDFLMAEYDLGESQPYDRSIDVRISRLRKKLEKNPKSPELIKTIYGSGYLFATKVDWTS